MLQHYLKKMVSATFFQAQCRIQPTINVEHIDFFEKTYSVNISLESKQTMGGGKVKELKICKNREKMTKAIVLFQGTNALIDYQKIENACRLAEKHADYAIYMRNYPGAGEGEVTVFSSSEIADDSANFLKCLANHYDIVYVKAISMGAAVASFSVAECHRAGYKNVYGLFARTYSSFALLLASRVYFSKISYPFFKLLLMYTDFDFTPVTHYLAIPETHKYAYRVVGDTVIPESASLVEHPKVRLEQKCHNANKNEEFIYKHCSVFRPIAKHPKDPHSISEHEVYVVENEEIQPNLTAKKVGDFYVNYIENHIGTCMKYTKRR